MPDRTAADLLVDCLEAEGVEHVFGIPGEETLDLNEALDRSSIEFVPVRHEQGGAYMADVYGRLTGRAGVCLGTLGPGATNLVTAVADAYLDRAPLVALTGQGDLERMHKESHQHLDIVSLMAPITLWNARLTNPRIVPEVVRKAFTLAQGLQPGPTHIELPEDVMAASAEGLAPLPSAGAPAPRASERQLERAAELLSQAERPIVLAGNGVIRRGAAGDLRAFAGATGIPVAETFMAKGVLDADHPLALGTVGLQARDYELSGFEEADVVVAVGYDLVEHAPKHWNDGRGKTIVCIDTTPAEIDEHFVVDVELIGDPGAILRRLTALVERDAADREGVSHGLRNLLTGTLGAARDDDAFPMRPPRVLWELRRALRPEDVLISDVGLHKLWIARLFPAHEPNTVLIANGLAGMGFAIPAAIAAKLVHPDRHVVTVNGDGGALMNFQELETAVRLRLPIVNVIWENGQYGSIVWKQERRFGRHFGTDFGNPDFVALAQAFGMPAWRCEAPGDFGRRLDQALALDAPSLIVVPIDYGVDVTLSDALAGAALAT